MEDTCTFPDCKFWKTFSDNPEECPNFQYAHWLSEDKKIEKRLKDCAPVRTNLMIKDLYNRLIGVQQSQEQQRNASAPLTELAAVVLERMANPDFYAPQHTIGLVGACINADSNTIEEEKTDETIS